MHFYQTQKKDTVETFSRHESAVRRCPKRRTQTNSLGIQHLNNIPTCVRRLHSSCVATVHFQLSQITARAQLQAFQSRERVQKR